MRRVDLPATLLSLPGGGVARIATQFWDLERWTGAQDSPGLEGPWRRKPDFAVDGRRCCAELAVLHHLRAEGWDGVWVSAFGGELRAEWLPAPAARVIGETNAPAWAAAAFERLRTANGGVLGGFFDVFAWRDPEEVRFDEVKVGSDAIRPTQRRFVERALRFHRPEQFTIIEVAQ